jgi:hypothetical protein
MAFVRGIDTALYIREAFVSLFGFQGKETDKDYS